jgi:hypothetical protein
MAHYTGLLNVKESFSSLTRMRTLLEYLSFWSLADALGRKQASSPGNVSNHEHRHVLPAKSSLKIRSSLMIAFFRLHSLSNFVRQCLCGLVVRVPGYWFRSRGFNSLRYQVFCEVAGLGRDPLGLIRITDKPISILVVERYKGFHLFRMTSLSNGTLSATTHFRNEGIFHMTYNTSSGGT